METGKTLNENKGFIYRFGPYALYTVCFAVVFALIFLFYIRAGKSFIQYGDGYRQGYFWMIEFKGMIDDLFAGNGIDFWNWNAGLGRPGRISSLFDPFSWLTLLFVDSHPELGYTISIAAQMYLSGIAFILAARKFTVDRLPLVLGALTYVFSSWVLNTALVQGNFIQNLILFPLLVLGVEWIYDKRSPILFSLVVGYYLIKMPYFAYMAAIVIVIYIFFRYFARAEEKGIKPFLKMMGTFIFYGVLGIMISMVILISSFYSLTGASSGSGVKETGMLFSEHYYNNLVPQLVGTGAVEGNYMYLGMAAVIILLFVCSIRRFSIKNTPLIMGLLSIVCLMFPVFNKMFNGFSYPTGRWYFMMIFFVVLTAMEHLMQMKRRGKADLFLMILAFCCMAACVYLKYFPNDLGPGNIFDTVTSVNIFATGINLLAALAVIIIFCIWKNESFRIGNNAVTVLLIITMGATALMWTPVETKKMRTFLKDGQIGFKLSQSVQRAGDDIDDDDFYRVDQVSGISVNKLLSKYANETLWWKTRSVYTYDSRIPSNLLYYNKLLGNNQNYVERITLFSNDNRAGLDLMTGVKYFLGTDIVKNNQMDQYGGYGFGYYAEKDGVSILKSKYSIGIGTGFDSYITQEEFEKLGRLEREQALLQAAVISGKEPSETAGMTEMKASDIDTDISDVPYTVICGPGAAMEKGKISITQKNAVITLHPSVPVTGQMMLSFDNLLKSNNQGFASGPFELECKAGNVRKLLMNKLGNQGIGDIEDYDVNLDYVEGYNGDINLTFRSAGEYTFDRIYISAMGMDNYDTYAKERQTEKFDLTRFEPDLVEGDIKAESDEILYLSIPANMGWSAYVDGSKTHIIRDLNYAFTGVHIPEGEHTVTLKYSYPGMEKGLIISFAGLILLMLFSFLRWMKFRRERKAKAAVAKQEAAEVTDEENAETALPEAIGDPQAAEETEETIEE